MIFDNWSPMLQPCVPLLKHTIAAPCKYVLVMHALHRWQNHHLNERPLPSPCQWAPQPCKWTSPPRATAGRNHLPSTFRTCVTLPVVQHMRDNWLRCWFPTTLMINFLLWCDASSSGKFQVLVTWAKRPRGPLWTWSPNPHPSASKMVTSTPATTSQHGATMANIASLSHCSGGVSLHTGSFYHYVAADQTSLSSTILFHPTQFITGQYRFVKEFLQDHLHYINHDTLESTVHSVEYHHFWPIYML